MRALAQFRAFRRRLPVRRLPHGLVHWRYLWPRRDPRWRVHRTLWWRSGDGRIRLVWLALEALLWLRWVASAAWIATWRSVREVGPEVRARTGLSLARQRWRLLSLALGGCIPPRQAYLFGLHERPGDAAGYVFDSEAAAFHAWRSGETAAGFAGARAAREGGAPGAAGRHHSHALLQDKWGLAQALNAAGVPMAPVIACVSRRGEAEFALWLAGAGARGSTRIFCKTRSGSRGEGAFAAWAGEGELRGRRLAGAPLPDERAVRDAWRRLIARDDVLVQPALVNHPALARLAEGEDAVTVRFISRIGGCPPQKQVVAAGRGSDGPQARFECLCATLEVPAGVDARGRPGHVLLPIDAADGSLGRWPERALLTAAAREAHERVWARVEERIVAQRSAAASTGRPGPSHASMLVPDWSEVAEASYRAHARFPGLWAIAWDWVVTPDGPLLLEGNAGWGPAAVQVLRGGLLADGDAAAEVPHTGSPRSSR